MAEEFKVGDRVHLVPDESWKQPYRGWAERKRPATVVNVFTYPNRKDVMVVGRFDRTRLKGAAGDYCFKAECWERLQETM
jgi:hypothetical protein|tara:strand:+ start:815 stop:1054 length:240 start_codon:yes stop_codon:yes gene_type:complete